MPVLDGWRGVAILVVVIHNAGGVLYGSPSIPVALVNVVLTSGWVGVQIFFVLSGFLITGILLDSAGQRGRFRNFYVRRTLRIFPLYYGFLFLALVVGPRLIGSTGWAEAAGEDGIWYWLYLSNWTPLLGGGLGGLNHLWSLAVEEQFYLVWPMLVMLSGRRFPLVALGIVLAAPAVRFGMYAYGLDPEYLYNFTIARADAFAVGALVAVIARRPSWTEVAWRSQRTLFLVISLALVMVVAVSGGFYWDAPLASVVGQSLIGIWIGILILSSLSPSSRAEHVIAGTLSAQWLGGFGKYSYAIYVLHFPMHAWKRVEIADLVSAADPMTQLALTGAWISIILGGSTILAFASWHLYEKHFLLLKDRWAPRPTWTRERSTRP
jgi:peptidoglycan/LPS O-acetylase OafA/YrhL